MIGLIQRVSTASVTVDNQLVGQINQGLLVLVGVCKNDMDRPEVVDKLAHKLLNYRVFTDEDSKMNLSALDTQAKLLLVSQFTLCANCRKGLRPSFEAAAPPDIARRYFDQLVAKVSGQADVETGIFGADMQVSLVNDGPVTFWLEV